MVVFIFARVIIVVVVVVVIFVRVIIVVVVVGISGDGFDSGGNGNHQGIIHGFEDVDQSLFEVEAVNEDDIGFLQGGDFPGGGGVGMGRLAALHEHGNFSRIPGRPAHHIADDGGGGGNPKLAAVQVYRIDIGQFAVVVMVIVMIIVIFLRISASIHQGTEKGRENRCKNSTLSHENNSFQVKAVCISAC